MQPDMRRKRQDLQAETSPLWHHVASSRSTAAAEIRWSKSQACTAAAARRTPDRLPPRSAAGSRLAEQLSDGHGACAPWLGSPIPKP